MLMNESFENISQFILTSKFQNDPIECRFSQERGLREVINSENILFCRVLIKMDINL